MANGNMTSSDAGQTEIDSKPPVDWIHIHETVKLLLLSMAQIELTLTDGEHNVTGLGQQFTQMADHLKMVNQYLSHAPETPDDIVKHGQQLEAKINEGVVAFQFYDRLSQRLDHVVSGLKLTEAILSNESERLNPDAWKTIQTKIKTNYSLDCERQMFDLVIKGTAISEALALYRSKFIEPNDDIELF